MGKDAPAPPPAPDYVGAAKAQGAANVTSAQQGAVLSNPNISSPYGSQSVSYSPLGGNDPNTSNFLSPSITQTLNPQSQQIFNQQQAVKMGLAGLGQQGIGTAQNAMNNPFQYNGPQIQTSVNNPQLQTSLGQQGPINYGPQAGQYGSASGVSGGQYGNATGQLNLSDLAKMPVNAGQTGQQAIMARLQPQIDQGNNAYNAQLANQGIGIGSQAYDNAMRVHNQQNNDLLSQAALQGIGLDFQANQQGYGQALSSGQFGNQAIAQNFGQGLAGQQQQNQAISQNFGQGLAAQQAQNQAQQQQYGQSLNSAQFANQAMGQQYNQGLGAAQFGNTAAQQAMAQQLQLRNQPLNEITALMSGSQIQNPQFQAYQGQNIQPAPLFNATQNQAAYNQGIYGLGVGQQNAQMGGLASLGGAGMGLYGAMQGAGIPAWMAGAGAIM